jgi:hypothetical protein
MSHSTNAHQDPTQPLTSTVEPDELDIKAIFGFGIGLAVVTAISMLLMLWMWNAEVRAVDAANPPRVFPLAVDQDERVPPEPRLQTDPKKDLKDLRAAEDVILNGYSWVDKNNKIVRIPVADAMKLTLQRGLPARTTAPAESAAPAASQEAK